MVLAADGPTAVDGSYLVVLKDDAVRAADKDAAVSVAEMARNLAEEHGGTVRRAFGAALDGFEGRPQREAGPPDGRRPGRGLRGAEPCRAGVRHAEEPGHVLPDPDEPLRVRTLLAMGFAGGLSPSPSAVVVLLGAAALGRAWYGVLLVLAYGFGLAATLTGIGFVLARWGDRLWTQHHPGRWRRMLLHRMPAATAATILAVGLGMAALATVSLLTGTG